jgi:transposase
VTGNYQYDVAQEQIADQVREADHWRRAAAARAPATGTKPPSRLVRISRRLARRRLPEPTATLVAQKIMGVTRRAATATGA